MQQNVKEVGSKAKQSVIIPRPSMKVEESSAVAFSGQSHRLSSSTKNQVHVLLPRLRTLSKPSKHTARRRHGRSLSNSPHDHAQMAALNDDGNTLRLKDLADGERNLLGETLLDLKTAGEHFGDAGELAEAEDAAVGDVADVHLASEGDEVVFAEREDFNVFDDDYRLLAHLRPAYSAGNLPISS